MDFSSIPMDQDHIDTTNVLSYDSSDKWTDHVKWQGSQTACTALNQLIKSSVNETAEAAPRLSGWQRVSSYDQLEISSLRSASRHDTASNSPLVSLHPRPSLSKPSSSSRPHSRARLSEARAPAPDTTNDLPIPLFNETDPMKFLHIMKGVSARLDENAGVRPHKVPNPNSGSSYSRAMKRTRGVSLGGASELQAGGAAHGMVKKGRLDELRIPDTLSWDEDKMNGRPTSEDESLDSEARGRSLQAHSSLPEIPTRSDLKKNLSSRDVSFRDVSFMDVDNKDDMHMELASSSAISSSSNHGYPDTRPFARTCSQTEMPPPSLACDPIIHNQRQPGADPPCQQSNISSVSTPLAVSRHSNSIDKPQTSYPLPQQLPNHSIKRRKSDAIPKLHPLLYHKPATSRVSSSSSAMSAPQVQLQHHPAPMSVSKGPDLKAPPPSSFMPIFSSTPSSRPPPLGMRRNHTFPSRTSSSSAIVQQGSSSYLTGSGSQLPQRPKGFKPPLLNLSQPQAQTQTQMHGLSQVKSNANIIVVESGDMVAATNKKVSSRNLPEASSTDSHGLNTTANTSMALRSSSSSSDSFRSTPPTPSASSSNSSGYSSSKQSDQGMTQHVQQRQNSVAIPEPLDGDADSSFGDMSFDMDALEETMKMYD